MYLSNICRLWQNPLGGLFTRNRNMFRHYLSLLLSKKKKKTKKKTGLASFESLEEYPKRWYCNRAELGDLISLGSLFKIPCTHIHPTAQLPTWRSTCSLFSVLGTEFRIKTVWLKFMIDFHISVETKDFTNMPTVLLCAFLNTFLII